MTISEILNEITLKCRADPEKCHSCINWISEDYLHTYCSIYEIRRILGV